jgi:hypothetical protein
VNDVVEMEELETCKNASDEELRLGLFEAGADSHVVTEVATYEEVHCEIKFVAVLEGVGHVD